MPLSIYRIISWLYLAVPMAACGLAVWSARRSGSIRPIRSLLRMGTAGALLGGAVALAYGSLGGGGVSAGQLTIACYGGIAVICALVGMNFALAGGLARLLRLRDKPDEDHSRQWAHALAIVIDAMLLVAIGMPYLGSLLLLYRIRAPSAGDPRTLIDAPFETVHFAASDGVAIEGWWIPATHNAQTDGRGSVKWGQDTVLLCHGFEADKARHLFLARDLVANGYNVLAIDLRAHGRSGGQLTGYGAVEGRDVLGAVRWLRSHRAGQCGRILGLGESLGAVALIEAAADPGPDGQAIDTIAAYNPYDDLPAVFRAVADPHTVAAGKWGLMHLAVPLASAQIGADLGHFIPARAAQALWPRPLLVLGNPRSPLPAYDRSYDLFDRAMQPKYGYFRDDETRDALLHDHTAALTVRIFFDGERSIL